VTQYALLEDGVRVSTHKTVEEAAEEVVEKKAYGRWEIKPTAGQELTTIERIRYYQIVGPGWHREITRRQIARRRAAE
jgi:hypothetical protein